jgi:hypothetical protein
VSGALSIDVMYGMRGSASETTKLNAIAVRPRVVEMAIRSATSEGSMK